MMVENRLHKQRPLVILLLGLLLLALVALAFETPSAHAAQVESLPTQRVQLETLTMINQQTGWSLEKDRTRALFTRNGLLHWTNVTPAGLHFPVNDSANALTAFSFLDAKHAYIGVLQHGATSLLRTQDSGKTWTSVHFNFSRFTNVDIYQITFLDVQHGWIAFDKAHGFGKYQIVLMSTSDGGKTWRQLLDTTQSSLSGLPNRGPKTFHFMSTQKGWMTGPEDAATNARLYETHDGGKTWIRVPLPALPNVAYSVSYGPYFTTTHDGTLLVRYGTLQGTYSYLFTYRTHDGGKTWMANTAQQTKATTEWNTLTFCNAEQGWVLGLDSSRKPIIHRTSDGGRSWKTVHPAGLHLFTEVILDLNFLTPTQGTTIDKADDGTQTLFQTNDAGQHWYALHPFLI